MGGKIDYLFLVNLDGYELHASLNEDIRFIDPKTDIEITISSASDISGLGGSHSNLVLRAKSIQSASLEHVNFVSNLIDNRLLKPDLCPVVLPYSYNGDELISEDGKISDGYSPTLDFLPQELASQCRAAARDLKLASQRFLQLLRWIGKSHGLFEIGGGDDPCFRLYWRAKQGQFHHAPFPRQKPIDISTSRFGVLSWDDEVQTILAKLWQGDEQEPLGHQLLREAKDVAVSNDRASLLICYSALEVGVKQHISKCAPISRWVVDNVPAPPLFKIIRNYIPILHDGNSDIRNWCALSRYFKVVQKFSEDRNKLAHRGEDISGSLGSYLKVTEDFLFIFDVLQGNSWAKSRVSAEVCNDLGWGRGDGDIVVTLEIRQ